MDYAIKHNPALRTYVLRWDLALLKMPFRSTTPFFLLDWRHPSGACQHQKIVVNPERADDRLEEEIMGSARALLFERLQ